MLFDLEKKPGKRQPQVDADDAFPQFSRPPWASSTKSSKLVIGPSLSCRRYTRDEGIELGIQCLRRREQLRVVPDRYQ
jgi:hypothetical protein